MKMFLAVTLLAATLGCGGGEETGAPSDEDDDCESEYCCGSGNCGGGMCTYPCRDDLDCPDSMACEHDTCFFRCDRDVDCAPGESCEHGDTVCEWGH